MKYIAWHSKSSTKGWCPLRHQEIYVAISSSHYYRLYFVSGRGEKIPSPLMDEVLQSRTACTWHQGNRNSVRRIKEMHGNESASRVSIYLTTNCLHFGTIEFLGHILGVGTFWRHRRSTYQGDSRGSITAVVLYHCRAFDVHKNVAEPFVFIAILKQS